MKRKLMKLAVVLLPTLMMLTILALPSMSTHAAPASIEFESVNPAAPAASAVRISQAYGGGGNGGALYRRDFVEIFNAGNITLDVTGWSIQYASAAGTS